MKWTLFVSTGSKLQKVFSFCNTNYPRTDENGWYQCFTEEGDDVLVQKRFVALMCPCDEEGE